MRIEFVHIIQLLAANIALPRVTLAMTTFMQEIESLIWKFDTTKQALKHSFATMTAWYSGQQKFGFRCTRRCDCTVWGCCYCSQWTPWSVCSIIRACKIKQDIELIIYFVRKNPMNFIDNEMKNRTCEWRLTHQMMWLSIL